MVCKINQFFNRDNPAEREILLTPAEEVLDVQSKEILDFIEDLEDTFDEVYDRATGLASNQIWPTIEYAPPAIFIFKDHKNSPVIAINPEVKGTGSKIVNYEGCLSLEGHRPKKKKRDKNVTIEYTTVAGERLKEKYTMGIARTIFHEMDHLKGKLI